MRQLLVADSIRKTYGDFVAIEDASIDVRSGEIHSMLGPNGAGKTTLVKILASLLRKDQGKVEIAGYDLDTQEDEIRQLIGYVGQDTERSAYARLTVRENLMYFGRLSGMSTSGVSERIEVLVESFGFSHKIDCEFGKLSGGQKQSAVIMRALLHDPLLIYLDEPTKGLDPISARRIRHYLKRYVMEQGRSILLTSHILTEVESLSDKVSLLHKGRIGITGRPQDLIHSIGSPDLVCLRRSHLSERVIDRIQADDSILSVIDLGDDLVGFGIEDVFEGLEAVIHVLRQEGIRTEIQHRPVSLEDAFIHLLGSPGERFESQEVPA